MFFFLSLGIYLVGVGCTALSWNLATFALFRFITGAGIGGEYSAINSAIDEFIPARLRGRVDLIVNGSFWLGAAAGAASTVIILNPQDRSVSNRMAPRLRRRRTDWMQYSLPAQIHSRKSAMVAGARAGGGGRENSWRY